jgi:nucleotide-binding universal stress UspA family protein
VSPAIANVAAAATLAGLAVPWDQIDDSAEATDPMAAPQSPGVPSGLLYVRGDVAAALLQVAAQHHAALVVVGKRHHLTGSVGRRLLASRTPSIVVVV